MWVQSLGQEYPLEEGMATHSSILAWRIPMHRGAWLATVHGVTKNRTHAQTIWLMVRLSSVVFGVLSADKKEAERSVLPGLGLSHRGELRLFPLPCLQAWGVGTASSWLSVEAQLGGGVLCLHTVSLPAVHLPNFLPLGQPDWLPRGAWLPCAVSAGLSGPSTFSFSESAALWSILCLWVHGRDRARPPEEGHCPSLVRTTQLSLMLQLTQQSSAHTAFKEATPSSGPWLLRRVV